MAPSRWPERQLPEARRAWRSLSPEERDHGRAWLREQVQVRIRERAELRARMDRRRFEDDEPFTVTSRMRSVPCDDPNCGTVLGPVMQMCADCAKQLEVEITKTASAKTITSPESDEPGQLTLFGADAGAT
jgi:hypothetical protein